MVNLKTNSNEEENQATFGFRFFSLFQHTGDTIFLFPLFFLLFLLGSRHPKLLAGLVIAGMTLTGLVVFTLKQIFRKERPAGTNGKMYRKYDRFSFPSGHAARVWAIVAVVANFYWMLAAGLSVWAALITYSRLKLQLHNIPDVFAGAIIGVVVGFFTVWLGSQLGFH